MDSNGSHVGSSKIDDVASSELSEISLLMSYFNIKQNKSGAY